jgi:hypothetical protein
MEPPFRTKAPDRQGQLDDLRCREEAVDIAEKGRRAAIEEHGRARRQAVAALVLLEEPHDGQIIGQRLDSALGRPRPLADGRGIRRTLADGGENIELDRRLDGGGTEMSEHTVHQRFRRDIRHGFPLFFRRIGRFPAGNPVGNI